MMTTTLIVILGIAVIIYGIGTIGGLIASNRAMSRIARTMDKTTDMMQKMIDTMDQ